VQQTIYQATERLVDENLGKAGRGAAIAPEDKFVFRPKWTTRRAHHVRHLKTKAALTPGCVPVEATAVQWLHSPTPNLRPLTPSARSCERR